MACAPERITSSSTVKFLRRKLRISSCTVKVESGRSRCASAAEETTPSRRPAGGSKWTWPLLRMLAASRPA
uniref:Uncharacterized protein n=1 Tax=Arundo donax TaxID=35708 RepID=A0A0A9E7J9_ARUDO